MSLISRWLDEWLNRCPSCGLRALAICDRCLFLLNETEFPKSSPRGLLPDPSGVPSPFVRRFLYDWDDRRPRSARVLRDVILSAKGETSDALVDFWTHEFARRATVGGQLSRKRNWIVFAPPTRRHGSGLDHAARLAERLSRKTDSTLRFEDGVLEHAPSRRGFGSQKMKSRTDRSQVEFTIVPHMKQRIESAEGFLLIDDVVASGSTAKAAWSALGKPKAFEVWAIAYRARLGGG